MFAEIMPTGKAETVRNDIARILARWRDVKNRDSSGNVSVLEFFAFIAITGALPAGDEFTQPHRDRDLGRRLARR